MGNSVDTTVETYFESDSSLSIKRVEQAPYNSDGWCAIQSGSVLNLEQCDQFDITQIRYKMKANKFPHRWGIGIAEYDLKNDKTDFSHKAGVDFVDGIAFNTLNIKNKQYGIDARSCRDKLVGVVVHIASAKLHFYYRKENSWENICSLDLDRNAAYKMIIRLPVQNDGVRIQDRSIWNKTTIVENNKFKDLQKTHDKLIKKQKEMEDMENILNRILGKNKQVTLSKIKQQNQEIKTFMNSISQQQAIVKSIQKQMQNMENILNTKLTTIENKQITLSKMKAQNQEVNKLMNCMKKQQDTVDEIQDELKTVMRQLAEMDGKIGKEYRKELKQLMDKLAETNGKIGKKHQNILKNIQAALEKNESAMKKIKKLPFAKYAAALLTIAGIYNIQDAHSRLKIASVCCACVLGYELYLVSKM
eukprot:288938_1